MKRIPSKTDCRTVDGVTVGLIDSVIFISRVLAQRLRGYDSRCAGAITEALKDLGCDDDLNFVLGLCPVMRMPEEQAKLYERVALIKKATRTGKEDARLRVLDKFVQKLPTRARNQPEDFGQLMIALAMSMPGMGFSAAPRRSGATQ